MPSYTSARFICSHDILHYGLLTSCPQAQVTLIPRGQAKGLTWFLPGEDPTLLSKQQIFARVVGALGGRAAEEVIFGSPEITTGASGDLQQVRPCWSEAAASSLDLTPCQVLLVQQLAAAGVHQAELLGGLAVMHVPCLSAHHPVPA